MTRFDVIGWLGLVLAAAMPLAIWSVTCGYLFDVFDMANDLRRRREFDASRRIAKG